MTTIKYKKLRKRILMIGFIGFVVMAFFMLIQNQVYALSDDIDDSANALKKIYSDYDDLFNQNDIISSALRKIGAGLLSLFVMLAEASSTLFDRSFGMMDFTSYGPVKQFLEDWRPVWIALLCVAFAWLGITLVFNSDKKPKIVTNLCVGVLVITSMTWMVGKMNTLLTKDIRTEILGTVSCETVYSTLGTNVHDLLYIDQVAGLENLDKKNSDGEKYANIKTPLTKKSWASLDINEVVFPDDVKDESKIIMEYYKTDMYDENGRINSILTECYDGVAWTDLLNTYYYRYSIDWLAAFLEMIAISIIFIFFTYKVVRTFYEVVFSEILAYLYSANVTNGQKAMKILDGIKNSYIMVMMALVSVRLYMLATDYISGKSWDGFSKGMMLFFVALAVIDGPNIVQKITGEDVGLSDGMQKVMSVMYGSSMAANMGRMVYGAGRSVVGHAANLGKKVAGAGSSAAAESAFESGAESVHNDNSGTNNNDNDMSQDVGAQFNDVDENNDVNEENDTGGSDASDSINGNVNADGRSGEMDDEAVAGINPDKMKEDTLNGMDPLGNNNADMGSTARMDEELDSRSPELDFGESRGNVLDNTSGFDKYMNDSGKYGNENNVSNKMSAYGSTQSQRNISEGGSTKVNSYTTQSSKTDMGTSTVSSSSKHGNVNSIKKQVLKDTEGSDT